MTTVHQHETPEGGGPGAALVPAPPQTDGTFAPLDTLRAVAALCVLTTHVAFWAGAYTGNGTLGTLLARLDVGVAVFFVLSGFLLSRGWMLRAAEGEPAPRVPTYLWRRALRILPIYTVTCVLALALVHDNRDLGWGERASTLLMVDTFVDTSFPAGLTHMWSLAVEVSFYLLLPLLMLALLGRRTGRTGRTGSGDRRVLAGLVVMVAVSVYWHLDGAARIAHGQPLQWLPAYLTWFAAGILLALVDVRRRRTPGFADVLVRTARQPGACWTVVVALMLVASTPLSGPTLFASPTEAQSLTKHLLYGAVGLLVVMTGVFADPASRYARVLSQPAGRRLGWISYGLFCLHLPVLHLVMWTTGWALFEGRGLQIWALTVVVSLVAADVGYRLVERPALRLKNLWSPERVAPTTTPASGTSIT